MVHTGRWWSSSGTLLSENIDTHFSFSVDMFNKCAMRRIRNGSLIPLANPHRSEIPVIYTSQYIVQRARESSQCSQKSLVLPHCAVNPRRTGREIPECLLRVSLMGLVPNPSRPMRERGMVSVREAINIDSHSGYTLQRSDVPFMCGRQRTVHPDGASRSASVEYAPGKWIYPLNDPTAGAQKNALDTGP
jgi:hypothetical protein